MRFLTHPLHFMRCAVPALAMLLGACATFQAPPSATADKAIRSYHPAIELSGRLSVRYQKNGNDEALHGGFNWQQRDQRTTVTLLSPLGQTIAQIEILPGVATLTEPGKPPRIAADVDALTAQALGWPLPVSGLRHWLQGFVVTQNGERLIASGQTETITTDDGWRMRYVSWLDQRPRRIDLDRYTEQAGNVALRIVIDNWQPQ